MGLLRRFLSIGIASTITDFGLLALLVLTAGLPVWLGNSLAVIGATVVSWSLHFLASSSNDPTSTWFRRTQQYLLTAVGALLIDVGVLSLLMAVIDSDWWVHLIGAKVVSVAAAFLVRSAIYRDAMFIDVQRDQAEPSRRPPAHGRFRLTVVVPSYKEADRIAETVERIRADLTEIHDNGGVEIIVVDDGSPDETAAQARFAGADQVVIHTVNRGKGAAVRSGVLQANGRVVAFTDADLAYSPRQLVDFVAHIENGWDVAVGSRKHVETRTIVQAGRLREFGGRLVNTLTGIVLLGRYRDTQCGLKAMRRDVGSLIFQRMRIEGFAFDVELFHLVERFRLTLVEVPVEVVNSSRSTVNVGRDALRLIMDLFRIRRWAQLGVYEPSQRELDAIPPASTPPKSEE